MIDNPGIDDPIWQYTLEQRLLPYIPYVRDWWTCVDKFDMFETGVMELDCPISGLYVRFTRVAIRSPIRGIQAFPFILAARLQLVGIQGGSTKMVERVCMGNKFKIDEFTVICRSHVRSIFSAAQIIAFVPTHILEQQDLGMWLYFTREEIALLAEGLVSEPIKHKARLKV